jgi:hypothetical protein
VRSSGWGLVSVRAESPLSRENPSYARIRLQTACPPQWDVGFLVRSGVLALFKSAFNKREWVVGCQAALWRRRGRYVGLDVDSMKIPAAVAEGSEVCAPCDMVGWT